MTTPTITLRSTDEWPALEWVPGRPPSEVQANLGTALSELAKRRVPVDERWRYYEGDHPAPWLTDKLRRALGIAPGDKKRMQDNYCVLAVNAVVLRLEVNGWTLLKVTDPGEGEEGAPARAEVTDADRAEALWKANELDLEQEELYQAAQVAGEHYVIVWPRYAPDGPDGEQGKQLTDEDTGQPLYDIVANDARNVYLQLGNTRRDRRWAAKVWQDSATRRWRANLYYGDEVVRLQTAPRSTGSEFPAQARAFSLVPDDPGGPNPMGFMPVFRFAHDRKGRSRLTPLLPIQDKINRLSANKMVTAEFLAWPQRYVLTAGEVPDDTLRPAPGKVLKLDPGGKYEDEHGNEVEAPATKVGEFTAADLDKYDTARREEVQTLLTIGQLPRRLQVTSAAAISGEAVRADEGPFVGMVEDEQQMYGGTWADIMQSLGLQVKPSWASAETANGLSEAQEVKALVDSGVPVWIALQYVAGWTDDQVEDLKEAMREAASMVQNVGSVVLDAFDRGEDPAATLREATDSGTGGATDPAVPVAAATGTA